MEDLILFLTSFWSTYLIVVPCSHIFTDKEGYGTINDKTKTLTGYIRKKWGFDLHHIHIGLVIFVMVMIFQKFYGWNFLLIALFGISISLILDQITPLMGFGNYFSKKMVLISLMLHLFLTLIFIKINFF